MFYKLLGMLVWRGGSLRPTYHLAPFHTANPSAL